MTAALAELLEAPAAPRRPRRSRRRPPSKRCPSRSAWPVRWRSATASSDAEHRAVRGGDPRGVGADPQAGRAAAAAGARRARRRCHARRPGLPPPVSIFAARRGAVGGRRVRGWRPTSPARRPRRSAPRASAPSSCSTAGSSGARARPLRRGAGRVGEGARARARQPHLPGERAAAARRARPAARGDARRSTSPARCASRARRWAPMRASGSTACLRLVAFDTMSGAEAVAAARAAGEKIGRSLGLGHARRARRALPRRSSWASSRRRSLTSRACASSCASASPARALTTRARRRATSRAGWWRARSRRSSGRPVRVRETACHGGCGDDACRFEIDVHLDSATLRSARGWRASPAATAPRARRPVGPRARARARWRGFVAATGRAASGVPGRSLDRARPPAGFARSSSRAAVAVSGTPARRAFDSPIAIACLVERAPCLPWRTCSISSCTNSPAAVDGRLSRAQLVLRLLDGCFCRHTANLRFAAPPASSARRRRRRRRSGTTRRFRRGRSNRRGSSRGTAGDSPRRKRTRARARSRS